MELHFAALADHELGGAAADVRDQGDRAIVGVALARRPEEGEPGFLRAVEDVRVESVTLPQQAANSSPFADRVRRS